MCLCVSVHYKHSSISISQKEFPAVWLCVGASMCLCVSLSVWLCVCVSRCLCVCLVRACVDLYRCVHLRLCRAAASMS